MSARPALQGDQPHVGFPEASYEWAVERLVRKGLRVIVVEQVRLAFLAHGVPPAHLCASCK